MRKVLMVVVIVQMILSCSTSKKPYAFNLTDEQTVAADTIAEQQMAKHENPAAFMGSAIFFHVWSLENNGIFHIEGTEYQ